MKKEMWMKYKLTKEIGFISLLFRPREFDFKTHCRMNSILQTYDFSEIVNPIGNWF